MKHLDLSPQVRDWISRFHKAHGRPPRVLHIGNIANNAYNNAKLMRAAGLDCDVICYDYYHVMGCPEWEDADFEDPPEDQFHPAWSEIDLHGFERPGWFAQGPDTLCFDYLTALKRGDLGRAALAWEALSLVNRTRTVASLGRGRWHAMKPLALVIFARIGRFLRAVVTHPAPREAVLERLAPLRARAGTIAGSVAAALVHAGVLLWRSGDALFRRVTGASASFDRRAAELIERFRAEFPERPDKLALADLECYERLLPRWRELCSHYDIVQGYSTDPILPLMCGKDYFAFEHGTLREIPLQDSAEGRITLLSYRLAQHVFVTNHDCLDMARRLAGERVSFINHPYDEDQALHVSGWERERDKMARLTDASFLFFHPTRHDWREGGSYAGKANDVFLRAFCELRRAGRRVGLVCCEWGMDVKDSKQLLAEQGCGDHVCWVPPMGITRFIRMARACQVVVDQFQIGAFGGVVFKALAAGAPVLTYLDDAAIGRLYPESPPVLNCRTTDQIVAAASRVMDNPGELAALCEASRGWIKKYHSAAQTVETQLIAYSRHA